MIPWVNSSVCLLWWLFSIHIKTISSVGNRKLAQCIRFLVFIVYLNFINVSWYILSCYFNKEVLQGKKKTFGIELSFAIFLHLFLISVWMMYVHVCILACMCKCKHVEVTRQFVNADFLPLQCSYWHQTQVVVFGNGYSYLWAISWAFIFIYLFS